MKRILFLAACLVAPAALAAPKIDKVTVKPNPAEFTGTKGPEIEVAVAVTRTRFDSGSCDVLVDFGDGSRPRTLDFSIAGTKITRYTYTKGGNFNVTAKGAGKTPCEGSQQVALTVKGQPKPEPKKAEPKKAEPKKAEPKKKPEPKKKAEPKKKDEAKKKAEPKKKGAEAPSS